MKLADQKVYNFAPEIGDLVWHIVEKWDYIKKDTIGKQLARSADSISANISEGYGGYHYKENKNFHYYSRGSAYKTIEWLSNAWRRGIIDKTEADPLIQKNESLLVKLNA